MPGAAVAVFVGVDAGGEPASGVVPGVLAGWIGVEVDAALVGGAVGGTPADVGVLVGGTPVGGAVAGVGVRVGVLVAAAVGVLVAGFGVLVGVLVAPPVAP